MDTANKICSGTKYIDHPLGAFVDRYKKDPQKEPIDVIMLTLDAVSFLERCLYSVYREIPVRRLLVCDGGSNDGTTETLEKYPRVQVFIKPDIRTTGKATEFLFSKVETEWFVLIDADIELPLGWYDEMCKHKTNYDFMECSGRILTYHFYRESPASKDVNTRPYDFCFLGRKEAIKEYRCEDDYVWRMIDFYLRQQIEKSGHKYGKVPEVYRIHHETERVPYESDPEKRFWQVAFKEPRWIILDREKWEDSMRKYAKGIVKYLDPEYPLVRNDRGFDEAIAMLSREWITEYGPAWLKRYGKATSLKMKLRRMAAYALSPLRAKFG